MRIHAAILGIAAGLALSATAGYAVQEFTLEEAQTRIERLEARVASLEATIVAGTGGTSEASVTRTVTGTVVIESYLHWDMEGPRPYEVGDPCHGDAGFNDIRAGAEVRALDGSGSVVGLGRLDTGVLADTGSARICQFSWTMEVDDAEFYAFEIAQRGGPSYSRAELEELGWTVDLIIGG